MTLPAPDPLPQNSQDLLGWRLIQKALSHHASSPATQGHCHKLRPAEDYESAKQALEETEEMAMIAESGESFPIHAFEDLEPVLKEASTHGILEPEQGLHILQCLRLAKAVRNFFQGRERFPHLTSLAIQIDPLSSLHEEFNNCINDEGKIREDATPELKQAVCAVRVAHAQLERELGKLMSNPSVKEGLQDAYFTEREGRLVLPIKAEWKSKIDGIVHDTSGSGATLFIEPSKIVPLNNQLKISRVRVDQEKIRIQHVLAASLMAHKDTIRINQQSLIAFDFVHARFRLAKSMGACRFQFSPQGQVNLKQARNPELILNGQNVVPNDIAWTNETRVIVISGPNTGGKTVTLKTVGLMALMASAGMFLPVEESSEMGFFPQVFADIGDEQSIQQNLSTFSAHLNKIIRIFDRAAPGSLILLDELGIATDPTQGSALAEAILLELKSKGMMTLVSTHYLSLKALAQTHNGFLNACTEFDANSNAPTYKLIVGAPGNSAALEIAERLGLDPKIIEKAQTIYQQHDTRAALLLQSLHHQKLDLEKERERLKEEKSKTHQLKKEQETLTEKIRQQENAFRKEKSRRLQSAVRETKNEIQNMIRKIKGTRDLGKVLPVEKKVRAIEEKLRSENAPDQSDWNLPPDQLSKGDSVIVKGYTAQGQLLENPNGRKKVRVKLGKLETRIEVDRLRGHPGFRNSGSQTPFKSLQITVETTKEHQPQFSCDLRGLRVEEAKEALEVFIDKAIFHKMNRIKIVHGHGMGAVKRFVRDYLESCGIGKSVTPGTRGEGGDGVTIVEF